MLCPRCRRRDVATKSAPTTIPTTGEELDFDFSECDHCGWTNEDYWREAALHEIDWGMD